MNEDRLNSLEERLERAVIKLDTFKATMIAEGDFTMAGVDNPTKELVIRAYQFLIDNGVVWSLQGNFGRNAHALIESGLCHER
jgi:hypothetical protein